MPAIDSGVENLTSTPLPPSSLGHSCSQLKQDRNCQWASLTEWLRVPGCRLGFRSYTSSHLCREYRALHRVGSRVTGQVNTGDSGLHAAATCCGTLDFKDQGLKQSHAPLADSTRDFKYQVRVRMWGFSTLSRARLGQHPFQTLRGYIWCAGHLHPFGESGLSVRQITRHR